MSGGAETPWTVQSIGGIRSGVRLEHSPCWSGDPELFQATKNRLLSTNAGLFIQDYAEAEI